MADVYEQEIEDWICENIATVVGHDDAILVGRQIRVATGGILDVLAIEPHENAVRPVVIEVKRDRVRVDTIVQALGYMGGIAHGLDHGLPLDYHFEIEQRETPVDKTRIRAMGKPVGIVVGRRIDPDAHTLLLALDGLVRYEEVETSIRVRPEAIHDSEPGLDWDDASICDVLQNALGRRLVWVEGEDG